ncbi:MAG: carboxypeptidase-like regulatory domain-containing protein [Chitinophagales bacterium]|nr:TonB-dependent receptor [Bacteroidota bacterium]
MFRNSILAFVLIFSSAFLFAQQPAQTIRGNIIDQASNLPLPYATISLENTSIGTVSDSLGNFTLKNIAIGRYNVIISFVGYEPVVLKEIAVSSAKEVVLNITMKESATTLDEIVIKPKVNKEQPLNAMATVSARMLSVDEAERYAGGFDDPARLVSAFAGVSSNVGNNAIIVRGNNPQSLQWKLEGIEISNPNHFADLSAFGGGGLTALSTQLLANSDFFSGAMPAEYSNALSGVFDIYMRNGNNQKHEHTFQLGAIGIDVASEGPFQKGNKSSYIFNYRYATLGLLAPILPENAAGTTYQDLSLKLNFPTKKTGIFSLWGIGLLDRSDAQAKLDISEWLYIEDRQNSLAKQFMGAVGISHKVFLNNKQFLKSIFATTATGIDLHTESVDSSFTTFPKNIINTKNYNFVFSSFLNTKFGAKHNNKSGLVITNMHNNMLLEDAPTNDSPLQTLVNENSKSSLIAVYSSSLIDLNKKISLSIGLTGQYFTLNSSLSIEPRAGVRYELSPTQRLSFAYGLHSRLERLNYYFIKDQQNEYLNQDLAFTKAQHIVAGYDINTSEFTHLKIETYFQYLFDVPVIADSSFSLINQQNDWFFDGKLENSGFGKNYGIDITFEKYLSKGYYYMATVSLFNSQYKGGDNVWRNTRYNRNFAFNFLIGKEWLTGKNKNRVWGINARVSYQGNDRYSPINESLSLETVVFDETAAFSLQYSPAFVSHFTTSYKINKTKTAQEFSLKIINLTQFKEYLGFRYNYRTQSVDLYREATFVPNISYKIEF